MKKIAYVGCRTTRERNARGKGLKVYEIDEKTKKWEEVQLLEGLENPSYMCLDNNEEYLYTVHGDTFSVSAYRVDQTNGKLEFINKIDTVGKNPVYITVSDSNEFVYVASLQGGSVYTLKRNEDGSITDPVHVSRLPGKSEEYISHAHQCIWDKNKEYLFVPTQGRNIGFSAINVFKANDDGSLSLTQRKRTRELDEVRHVAIHENNRYLYSVNEKNNSVTFHIFDQEEGRIDSKQILTSLPDTYVGEGQASAILIHPNNRYLYVSNRIHESIAIFSIDEKTGFMKYMGNVSTLGNTPRFMTFNDDGTELIVANEDSDTIQVFAMDEKSGGLIFTGTTVNTESPVCIVFVDVDK